MADIGQTFLIVKTNDKRGKSAQSDISDINIYIYRENEAKSRYPVALNIYRVFAENRADWQTINETTTFRGRLMSDPCQTWQTLGGESNPVKGISSRTDRKYQKRTASGQAFDMRRAGLRRRKVGYCRYDM